MGDEGPCEWIWNHEMTMRRLLSLVSSPSQFCGCIQGICRRKQYAQWKQIYLHLLAVSTKIPTPRPTFLIQPLVLGFIHGYLLILMLVTYSSMEYFCLKYGMLLLRHFL